MPDEYLKYNYLKPRVIIQKKEKPNKLIDDTDILDNSESCLDDTHDND